jgi:hypothetical protein
MTDPIRTPAEALEAAAQEADAIASYATPPLWNYGTKPSALDKAERKGRQEAAEEIATHIRALAVLIKPDDIDTRLAAAEADAAAARARVRELSAELNAAHAAIAAMEGGKE